MSAHHTFEYCYTPGEVCDNLRQRLATTVEMLKVVTSYGMDDEDARNAIVTFARRLSEYADSLGEWRSAHEHYWTDEPRGD
jgi:hypothetical protein